MRKYDSRPVVYDDGWNHDDDSAEAEPGAERSVRFPGERMLVEERPEDEQQRRPDRLESTDDGTRRRTHFFRIGRSKGRA